jgi:pyruvate,water dikinase
VLEKSILSQENMLICRHDEGLEDVPVANDIKGKPSLTDEQIMKLAECAVSIENHYKSPQDIEWAMDSRGAVYILQTRNLRVFDREAGKFIPSRMDGYNILIDKGSIASRGIGFGMAFVVKTMEDLNNFPENAVLVAKNPSTEFVTVMNRANAIITDMGGTTVHMASLAREFGVPKGPTLCLYQSPL